MIRLIRKIHIYAGLLTFAHLAIYGAAGIVATFQPGPERSKTPRTVRFLPFKPAPSATDKEVAGAVYEALKPPLSRPVPDWFLQHTPDNKLLLDFYNINSIYRVIVLEDQSLLRVEEIRNSVWLFLEDMTRRPWETMMRPLSSGPGPSGMRRQCGRCWPSAFPACFCG